MKLVTGTLLAVAVASAMTSISMARADLGSLRVGEGEIVGTFEEGLEIGLRNGGLIAQRAYKKTLEGKSCRNLGTFQYALNAVVASAKPTPGRSTKFVAGFYQGYLQAVKNAIKEARQECKVSRFGSGLFPGALVGDLYCQVATYAPEAIEHIAFSPIYDDWNHDSETLDECAVAFAITTGDCVGSGIASQLLASTQAAACRE